MPKGEICSRTPEALDAVPRPRVDNAMVKSLAFDGMLDNVVRAAIEDLARAKGVHVRQPGSAADAARAGDCRGDPRWRQPAELQLEICWKGGFHQIGGRSASACSRKRLEVKRCGLRPRSSYLEARRRRKGFA
jgi:hypothetical protein